MNTADLKARAKALLSQNYGYCLAVSLIMYITGFASGGGSGFSFNFNYSTGTQTDDFGQFSYMLEEIFTNPFVIFGMILASLGALVFGLAFAAFVGNQLRVGGCRFFLKNRKSYPTDIKTVFASYTDKTFLNIAKVTIIRDIITKLGYMLFIIPGIIWTYQYFAVDYILAVRPDISYSEALSLSKRMMNGHKMDLFVLDFSFFGWYILTAFTCGILGIFYVTPYVELTNTEFFADVRADAIRKGVITENDVPDYPEYADPSVIGANFNNGYAQQGYAPYAQPEAQPQPADSYYSPFEAQASQDVPAEPEIPQEIEVNEVIEVPEVVEVDDAPLAEIPEEAVNDIPQDE